MSTFRQLDRDIWTNPSDSPLSEWYERVRDVPINQLGIGDISRACRQRLFLEYTVPVLVEYLDRDPLAGELYDGELASTVAKIPSRFWCQAPELAQKARNILREALSKFDADVAEEVTAFFNEENA